MPRHRAFTRRHSKPRHPRSKSHRNNGSIDRWYCASANYGLSSIGRVERHRAIIAPQRRFPPAEALQHDASVAVSVRVVSVPFDRTILPGERFLESPDDTQCIAAFVVRGESRRVQSDSLIVWQNRALIILRRCTRFAAAVLTSSNTLGALDSRVGAEYAQDASTAERRHDPRR